MLTRHMTPHRRHALSLNRWGGACATVPAPVPSSLGRKVRMKTSAPGRVFLEYLRRAAVYWSCLSRRIVGSASTICMSALNEELENRSVPPRKKMYSVRRSGGPSYLRRLALLARVGPASLRHSH